MTSLLAAPPGPGPLEQLPIEALRARTSMKWRAYPADVLPLWVAEIDVPLAPSVAAALHAAIDAGDTGYPCSRSLMMSM
jgi:cysteine-S-conjugate beta-lyase